MLVQVQRCLKSSLKKKNKQQKKGLTQPDGYCPQICRANFAKSYECIYY